LRLSCSGGKYILEFRTANGSSETLQLSKATGRIQAKEPATDYSATPEPQTSPMPGHPPQRSRLLPAIAAGLGGFKGRGNSTQPFVGHLPCICPVGKQVESAPRQSAGTQGASGVLPKSDRTKAPIGSLGEFTPRQSRDYGRWIIVSTTRRFAVGSIPIKRTYSPG
jgi:hypothetical protein